MQVVSGERLGQTKTTASRTGSAQAATGGIAVSGILAGDIIYQPGVPARSGYIEQVRRIAPLNGLKDRSGELAEMAAFCTEADRDSYLFWRAPAWAGKTALLASFVLNPPPGIDIVSFFITARFASQNDRAAFIDVVQEQLAALLGQPAPTALTDATREAHLLRLFGEAAEFCRGRGRRLILVVDGLDEDRGVTVDPDAYSVAALLPAQPPAGMRVVVAGRPNPPIPHDVPEDHPLRTVSRDLVVSTHALAVRADCRRELKRLLAGSRTEQDLLGLVAAAGGGLSGSDLAELTNCSLYDVEEHLHAVSGRTFSARNSHYSPENGPLVYVLGHEELQLTALQVLGEHRLQEYRQRLHCWVERYRDQDWPVGTPEYLLRGYFNLLHAQKDTARIIALALDSERHDRMLHVTGADAAAISEVHTTLDFMLSFEEPDLAAMARLSFHKDQLTERGSPLPRELPAVWSLLGRQDRAEALAHSIPQSFQQARSYRFLVEALIESQRFHEAERIARSIADPHMQVQDFCSLARALYDAEDRERALALINEANIATQEISNIYERGWAIGSLAEAHVFTGSRVQAYELIDSIADPELREQAVIKVVEALALVGEREEAVTLAQTCLPLPSYASALSSVARCAAAVNDLVNANYLCVDAERAASEVESCFEQAKIFMKVAEAYSVAGDLPRAAAAREKAEMLACTVSDAGEKARLFASLARLKFADDDARKLRDFCDRATESALDSPDHFAQSSAIFIVSEALLAAGEIDSAEEVIGSISTPYQRLDALRGLFKALVLRGDYERAIAIAEIISELNIKADCFASLAGLLVRQGEFSLATKMAVKAEAISRLISHHSYWGERGGLALVEALVDSGQFDCAEALSGSYDYTDHRVAALCYIAIGHFEAGGKAVASAMIEEAERLSRDLSDASRPVALIRVAQAAAVSENEELARALIDEVEAAVDRVDRESSFLGYLAVALASVGDYDRAWECMDQAEKDSPWEAQGRPDLLAHDLLYLANVATDLGNIERAKALCARVESIANSLTDHYERPQVFSALAQQLVKVNELDHAESIMRMIHDNGELSAAMAALVKALFAEGSFDRARVAAKAVTMPDDQAAVRSVFALQVDEKQARLLLAEAFRIGHWTIPLSSLRAVCPSALAELAESRIHAHLHE
ncbi:tetratricopeptide repeat protein [Streptomyces mirabilis]|uniref:hypothetical protein n=1 Tax=Streptomyces mirabilis TaxID=68239 RepID=UPI003663825D